MSTPWCPVTWTYLNGMAQSLGSSVPLRSRISFERNDLAALGLLALVVRFVDGGGEELGPSVAVTEADAVAVAVSIGPVVRPAVGRTVRPAVRPTLGEVLHSARAAGGKESA